MNPKNVYVIGAQSTGKSTIVRVLEDTISATPEIHGNQKPTVIREVAREVLGKYGFSREDITMNPKRAMDLQWHILHAQYDAETEASAVVGQHWYISDRSGLDPVVYAKVFVGEDAAQQLLESVHWKELQLRMQSGIVVLCEAGTTWLQDDGVRLMPKDSDDWMRVDKAFRELLEAQGIGYIVIPRDIQLLNQRVSLVVDALAEAIQISQTEQPDSGMGHEMSIPTCHDDRR